MHKVTFVIFLYFIIITHLTDVLLSKDCTDRSFTQIPSPAANSSAPLGSMYNLPAKGIWRLTFDRSVSAWSIALPRRYKSTSSRPKAPKSITLI